MKHNTQNGQFKINGETFISADPLVIQFEQENEIVEESFAECMARYWEELGRLSINKDAEK